MTLGQRKAQEYLGMLKLKSEKEIISVRDNLKAKLKGEQSKEQPDDSAVQNFNFQLSMIGRELSARKPPVQAKPASTAQHTAQPTEQPAEKELVMAASGDTESKTPEATPENSIEPKKEEAHPSSEKKSEIVVDKKIFGMDSDVITIGVISGVIGGAIGFMMGKSGWHIAGFAILGAGVGGGIVHITKKSKDAVKVVETKKV